MVSNVLAHLIIIPQRYIRVPAASEQDWMKLELQFPPFPCRINFRGSEEGQRDPRPLTPRSRMSPATPRFRTPYTRLRVR